ncbi:transcriptional repressor [Streptococcus phage Javan226]|uniref:Phage transcriptional repressor n=1 Tax=Streptococcus gallolyticus TaxID=315405 RepID=A0A139R434_9STRE|nr:S24 family peptidase [Streptococcus gallolyticus]KXU09385.1 Phage transcriptional repressor [Streptococcus gallolyticus]QBX25023.1 transcriptional repressor [Streptococcus phage Javan226]
MGDVKNNFFASNLKFLRQKQGMEQLELAHMLGRKSSSSISEWEKGRYTPKSGILSDIANIFNVTLSDLMEIDLSLGNSSTKSKNQKTEIQSIYDRLNKRNKPKLITYGNDLLKKQKSEEEQRNNIIQFPKLFPYKFFDQALSAGTGQYLNDVQVEQIELPIDVDADFVVPIYGDSMEPDYHSGDYVFVKLSVDLSSGDIGVFEYYGDAYIKELVINDSGAYLHSLNPKYDDILVDADSDFRIIGEVVGKYRED